MHDLHDEPAASPGRPRTARARSTTACRRSRATPPGRAAALRRPSAADRDGRPADAQGLVPPLRRGARRRGGRALHRLGGARRRRSTPRWPTCSSPPPRTTATSRSATSSTSPTRPSRRSTSPAGRTPRRSWPAWPRATPAPAAWRSRTPGATRWTWWRSWRTPSSGCRTALEEAEPARAVGGPRGARCPCCSARTPQAIADALLEALREGATRRGAGRGGRLRRRAADRPLPHQQRVRRLGHRAAHLHLRQRRPPGAAAEPPTRRPELLLRGVFDAAMSVYLDRFLNVPPARLPEPEGRGRGAGRAAGRTPGAAGRTAAGGRGGRAGGPLPLRGRGHRPAPGGAGRAAPPRGPQLPHHTDGRAGVRQHALLRGTAAGTHVLVAAARYLAAHSPTMRAQGRPTTSPGASLAARSCMKGKHETDSSL